MARFNEFISNIDISELKHFIETNGSIKRFTRGDILCEQGKVCHVVGIVLSGYFKYSVINSRGEIGITGDARIIPSSTYENHSPKTAPVTLKFYEMGS